MARLVIPHRIAEARSAGRLAYLAGAGVSRDPPASRPMAGEIAAALTEGLWLRSTVARRHLRLADVCHLARTLRFESLVQLVADTAGSVGFLRVVDGGRPNFLHRCLAGALSDGCPVLTTNFDRLIESAHPRRGSLRALATAADFQRHGAQSPRGVLAKLHGSSEDQDSLCATLANVGRLGPAFAWDVRRGEYLARVRRDFPLVVLGYSGADDLDVMPRLEISKSTQPLLWVVHGPSPVRTVGLRRLDRLPLLPEVRAFLRQQNAHVWFGPTREALALIEGCNPPAAITATPTVNVRAEIFSRLGFAGARWVHDFVLSRAVYLGGQPDVALKLFSAIRRRAWARNRGVALRCLVNEASILSDLGKAADACALLQRALPELRSKTDDSTWCLALLNWAVLRRELGATEESRRALENLLVVTKKSAGMEIIEAHATQNLADLLFERGELDRALIFYKKARRLYKRAGDQTGLAKSFGGLAKLLFAKAKTDKSRQTALVASAIALWHGRAARDPQTVARLLNNRGTIERSMGLADRAEASFREARVAGRKAKDPVPVLVSWMGMVTVALIRRDLRRAQWYARRCLSAAEKAHLWFLAAQTRGNLGLALLDAGKPKEAATEFTRALDVFRRLGDQRFVAFTEANLAECRKLAAIHRPQGPKLTNREAALD